MSGSSEEKSLPPSQRKLDKAREEGQIAKSPDVIAAATMVTLSLYLVFGWPSIMAAFARMFQAAGTAAGQLGPNAWRLGIAETWSAMTSVVAPLYFIAFVAIFVGSIVSNKGLVFAMKPITPDLNRINPATGFKKIFSARNFVEFLKALFKSMLLLVGLSIVAWFGFRTLMRVPMCEDDCYTAALIITAAPLIFMAMTLFVASALIDSGLQRWLFEREQRMTVSEQKREMKESFGDPQLRKARSEFRREGATAGAAPKTVAKKAPTLILTGRGGIALALRYVPGETRAPVILSKGKGVQGFDLIESARRNGIPVANEPALAQELYKQSKRLSFVPAAFFKDVARALVQSRSTGT